MSSAPPGDRAQPWGPSAATGTEHSRTHRLLSSAVPLGFSAALDDVCHDSLLRVELTEE